MSLRKCTKWQKKYLRNEIKKPKKKRIFTSEEKIYVAMLTSLSWLRRNFSKSNAKKKKTQQKKKKRFPQFTAIVSYISNLWLMWFALVCGASKGKTKTLTLIHWPPDCNNYVERDTPQLLLKSTLHSVFFRGIKCIGEFTRTVDS